MAKQVKCAQENCQEQCKDGGLHAKSCKECRKSGVCRKNGGSRNKSDRMPLSLLKEVSFAN